MVSFSLTGLISLFALLVNLGNVAAAPAHGNGTMFNNPNFVPPTSQLATRATPAAPYWVAYSDAWVSAENGPPAPSVIKHIIFPSALRTPDQAIEWVDIGASARSSIKSQYAAAGIKMLVSAFGSTDAPTSEGADPVATANTMAAWVIQYGLDGIDVDYEDFNAINAQNGKAEAWLESFTKQLRVKLPQGTYIITHAPVAPWFSPGKYSSGAYAAVNSAVGNLIDWYNVQFITGSSEYTTCAGLLTTSSSTWPQTAVFQLAANGVPLNKIVIGKPATTGDASNGYISTSTLASCLQQAKAKGWSAGAMVWEYPDASASWIAAVRASSWPV